MMNAINKMLCIHY